MTAKKAKLLIYLCVIACLGDAAISIYAMAQSTNLVDRLFALLMAFGFFALMHHAVTEIARATKKAPAP
jgi:hypothetical protein